MKFDPPLERGKLVKRYKRFLADIVPDNEPQTSDPTTIHCPNTGAMKGCAEPGSTVYYSTSDNPKRKYPNTWEIVSVEKQYFAGVNTHRANQVVREGIESGIVTELQNYFELLTEVQYGENNSRVDILLRGQQNCYVEVKSVTLWLGEEYSGLGAFPDAVTTRGHKHLRDLIAMKHAGHRAVLFFCVQHTAITQVSPADDIDPIYGKLLRLAIEKGVEVIAYGCLITADEITLKRPLKVIISNNSKN